VVVGSLLCVVQAMMMLHLWVAKAGHVQVSELERVLKRVGREDIINRCIHGNPADDSVTQLADGNGTADQLTIECLPCLLLCIC